MDAFIRLSSCTIYIYIYIYIYIIQSLHAGTISLTPPRARHRTLRKLLRRKLVTFTSTFSGRNYDFRCTNIVFCVFLRESAKRRTNLSTHSGKAIKRLDHLDQIWQTCADSSGNGYTPNKLPSRHKGAHGGFRESKNQNMGKLSNGWTDWHHI